MDHTIQNFGLDGAMDLAASALAVCGDLAESADDGEAFTAFAHEMHHIAAELGMTEIDLDVHRTQTAIDYVNAIGEAAVLRDIAEALDNLGYFTESRAVFAMAHHVRAMQAKVY
jgi:hypothetical protein